MKDILKFNKSEIQLTLKSKSMFFVSSWMYPVDYGWYW